MAGIIVFLVQIATLLPALLGGHSGDRGGVGLFLVSLIPGGQLIWGGMEARARRRRSLAIISLAMLEYVAAAELPDG